MTLDVTQPPGTVGVSAPNPQLVIQETPAAVAVRVLETAAVETERVEHVVVQEERAGILIVAVGMQGPPGSGGGGGSTTEDYVAAVALGGHRVLVTDAAGLAIYADNTLVGHANMATKISTGAAIAGDVITTQLVGRMTEPSWSWVVGGTIYVGSNGLLTQTPPADPAVFSKPIAVAETATRILLIQESPVML